MPVLYGSIQPWLEGGVELVVTRYLLQAVPPVTVTKASEPYRVALQCFGKMIFSAFKTNCTQEFSLMGSNAMISLPAITMMAMTAAVVGSMKDKAS